MSRPPRGTSAADPGRRGRSSRSSITVNRAITHHHKSALGKGAAKATEGELVTSATSVLRPSAATLRRRSSALVRARALSALRVRPFRAYALALALTSFGTWVQNITQDWLVLTL